MNRIVLAAALLTVAACEGLTGPSAGDKLTAARRRWLTEGLYSYSYEVRRDCFCQHGGLWAQVNVVGGRVISGTWLDPHTAVSTDDLNDLPTINSLFDDIERALAEHAVMLQASYDPRDGHPTFINVDVSRNIVDEEFAVETRSMSALFELGRTTGH